MDTRTFFDIMGTAPAMVTVVTTLDGLGRPQGLTVAAVMSVSAEPPILLVCIDRRSRTLPAIRERAAFAVNFLRGDRADVAARFASAIADRFAGVDWCRGAIGMPVLHRDVVAHAECETTDEHMVGDHAVLFARVVAGARPPTGSRPLTYFRHRYTPWPGHVDDAIRVGSSDSGVARVLGLNARVADGRGRDLATDGADSEHRSAPTIVR